MSCRSKRLLVKWVIYRSVALTDVLYLTDICRSSVPSVNQHLFCRSKWYWSVKCPMRCYGQPTPFCRSKWYWSVKCTVGLKGCRSRRHRSTDTAPLHGSRSEVGATTFSIMAFRITTLGEIELIVTFSLKDIQHNETNIIMKRHNAEFHYAESHIFLL